MVVSAEGGACNNIVGTIPVPIDWPEQEVTVVNEDISPLAHISYETVEGVKQMIVTLALLPPGREAKALVTFEVKRSEQIAPDDTDVYVLPDKRKLDKSVRPYLAPSPLIESNSPKIRALAKQIGVDKENAWQHVEAIYDWVRDKVKYQNGPIKGALAGLQDGTGDCEELTSLFIAICRAAEIPARTVWVPGHCYPEFYLFDKDGKGHWFPCQAAGSRSFGGIPESRPILQKGDNFRDGRDRKRYMAEKVTGGASAGKPKVKFVREIVAE
jgi:transglutaminase-like putative cysteine protease